MVVHSESREPLLSTSFQLFTISQIDTALNSVLETTSFQLLTIFQIDPVLNSVLETMYEASLYF